MDGMSHFESEEALNTCSPHNNNLEEDNQDFKVFKTKFLSIHFFYLCAKTAQKKAEKSQETFWYFIIPAGP